MLMFGQLSVGVSLKYHTGCDILKSMNYITLKYTFEYSIHGL